MVILWIRLIIQQFRVGIKRVVLDTKGRGGHLVLAVKEASSGSFSCGSFDERTWSGLGNRNNRQRVLKGVLVPIVSIASGVSASRTRQDTRTTLILE